MEPVQSPSPEKEALSFQPTPDKWYDALLKKLPAGWRPDAKLFVYIGFGLLIFVGLIASTATDNRKPQEVVHVQSSPAPTLPPNIDDENPVSQKKFVSTKYNFSLTHPGLSDKCCFIVGPTFGNFEAIGNLSDPSTVRRGADAPFDGLSLYVVNLGNIKPDAFLKKESQNLIDQYKKINGAEPKTASWQTLSVSSQSAVLLKNYNSLTVNRYYIQFPNENMLLYIGASESSLGSFNHTLNLILQSLKFEDASTSAQPNPQS